MAYYDVVANVALPQFGTAIASGLQAGQRLRKGALGMEQTRQKMQESALQTTQKQEDRQRVLVGLEASKVTDQTSYDSFLNRMRKDFGETEEGLLEDGLVPKYTPEVANILQGAVLSARGLQKDYTLGEGSERISGVTGKVIARTPRRPEKIKQLPMNFAEKLADRMFLDLGDALEDMSQEDITLIRATAADKVREGMDFEAAYTSTAKELNLEEFKRAWYDPRASGYRLAPQQEQPTAPQPEQLPMGQSVRPQLAIPQDTVRRVEEIRKLRTELEAQRNTRGAGA